VVAIFSRALAEGTTATVFGDGSSTRDYVYVEDVVGAFVAAADSDATGAFNIGTGRETSVVDLLAALSRAAGVAEVKPEHAPEREGEVRRSCLDAGLAARTLGFATTRPLEAGLRATYESYAQALKREGDSGPPTMRTRRPRRPAVRARWRSCSRAAARRATATAPLPTPSPLRRC
jgi:UDP-glucose 4-epimerase